MEYLLALADDDALPLEALAREALVDGSDLHIVDCHTALLHKAAGDPETMPARTVLDMATRGGAAAMGGDGGTLAVGRPADCIALDLSAPNMQPLFNAASHAVYAATGMEVALTMVAGEVLYRDGRFTRFDYPALCAEVREMRRFVLRRLGLPEQVA